MKLCLEHEGRLACVELKADWSLNRISDFSRSLNVEVELAEAVCVEIEQDVAERRIIRLLVAALATGTSLDEYGITVTEK